ncbi:MULTISPECIES: gamma-glutamyltransferase family protein [Pseudovibrio]|uniref:gamma-glutamyltransferase family protein n=1 Tax=Stappiaceae TaxID=2821832 RepID=UPI0023672711|nr:MULTISPECIES: gamma-glutamyltransferase family protein [Pseudovibrio]MDD7911812.1 gamma-glutamyltransferase family protein [Pseudovibrio exalbescens]MDX5594739.1 gamma-glutamyltransferase family protein [Pseudovibrio sp. SPO723]
MLETVASMHGMVTAPHKLASEAGSEVLKAGGTALDAMIAAASTIAVVYPHMNHLGGDGFWLIAEPGRPPKIIEACGAAGSRATIAAYNAKGYGEIPARGPHAALTVAGAVGGWQLAHEIAAELGGGLPLRDLLAFAIDHAKSGYAVSKSQAALTREKLGELKDQPGFADVFLEDGKPPEVGSLQKQRQLAQTLDYLANSGLHEFYKGDVGQAIAADLEKIGSPVVHDDLRSYEARLKSPLSLKTKDGTLFNAPPPTQGLASLLILGLYERMNVDRLESPEYFHALIEATKRAFIVRDEHIADPWIMSADPKDYLKPEWLDKTAFEIDRKRALHWPHEAGAGDTVWLGAMDAKGRSVSYIQSVFWEFGSGCVLPQTGILWQNRGASFSLHPEALRALKPGRLPFHTLNPAMARLDDGRTLVYGTMGGDGQPQTQAAIFTRAIHGKMDPAEALDAPRWLLGRTWGSDVTSVRVEKRFDEDVLLALRRLGHDIEILEEPYSDVMGHAGLILRGANGEMRGAHDPRSDGAAVAA